MKSRSFRWAFLFFLLWLNVNSFAQDLNYVKDLSHAQKEKILKSSGKEKTKKVNDSLVAETYGTEEDDKVYFMGKDSFPTTQKGKFLYFIEGQEMNGKKTGLFRFSAFDAKDPEKMTLVKEVTYANDTMSGPYTYYYANGAIALKGNHVSGRPEGATTVYYPDGKIYNEFTYVNGRIDGVMKMYYHDGNLKLTEGVKQGKPHGPFRTYYRDGKLEEEINYVDGVGHGKYLYYHPNGQLWVEKEYKSELLWNVIVNYDSSGKLMDKGTLKDGDGTVKCYDDTGKLYLIEHVKKGKIINKEEKK